MSRFEVLPWGASIFVAALTATAAAQSSSNSPDQICREIEAILTGERSQAQGQGHSVLP